MAMPNDTGQENTGLAELQQAEDRLVDSLALVLAAIARELYVQEEVEAVKEDGG